MYIMELKFIYRKHILMFCILHFCVNQKLYDAVESSSILYVHNIAVVRGVHIVRMSISAHYSKGLNLNAKENLTTSLSSNI